MPSSIWGLVPQLVRARCWLGPSASVCLFALADSPGAQGVQSVPFFWFRVLCLRLQLALVRTSLPLTLFPFPSIFSLALVFALVSSVLFEWTLCCHVAV